MLMHLVFALLRAVIIPGAAVIVLSRTILDLPTSLLLVNLVNTVLLLPEIVWHIIKLIPNIALFRVHFIAHIMAELVVEVCALIAFWLLYISVLAR